MPKRALSLCTVPGCNEVTNKRHCSRHQTDAPKQHQREHRRLYHTQRWRRLRRLVLAKQPLCQACLIAGDDGVGQQVAVFRENVKFQVSRAKEPKILPIEGCTQLLQDNRFAGHGGFCVRVLGEILEDHRGLGVGLITAGG